MLLVLCSADLSSTSSGQPTFPDEEFERQALLGWKKLLFLYGSSAIPTDTDYFMCRLNTSGDRDLFGEAFFQAPAKPSEQIRHVYLQIKLVQGQEWMFWTPEAI